MTDVPLWVEAVTFDDERNRVDWWYPYLPETVTSPLTIFFEVSPDEDEWCEEEIVEAMNQHNLNRVFVRSVYKSAVLRKEGSIIFEPLEKEVKRTVQDLYSQHQTVGLPFDGWICIREWIDLKYCPVSGHKHLSEVRFFIRDGDILYSFPSVEEMETDLCASAYSFVEEMFSDVSLPTEQAEAVAEQFQGEGSFHVDFALTTKGDWVCIDMGVNGLRYVEETDEWINMSGHREGSEHNLEEMYGEEFTG